MHVPGCVRVYACTRVRVRMRARAHMRASVLDHWHVARKPNLLHRNATLAPDILGGLIELQNEWCILRRERVHGLLVYAKILAFGVCAAAPHLVHVAHALTDTAHSRALAHAHKAFSSQRKVLPRAFAAITLEDAFVAEDTRLQLFPSAVLLLHFDNLEHCLFPHVAKQALHGHSSAGCAAWRRHAYQFPRTCRPREERGR